MLRIGSILGFLFMAISSLGQSRIFIESNVPIEVGVSNQLLSREPHKKVVIETIDTALIVLIKPKGEPVLTRYISLKKPVVLYVVGKNRLGRTRVWFRGTDPIPEAHLLIEGPELPPWPYVIRGASTVASTKPANLEVIPEKNVKSSTSETAMDSLALRIDGMKKMDREFERLQLALDLAKGGVTVDQIIRLSQPLTYETSRLEFFIKAYPYCKDKENYLRLLELLEYDSSRNQLKKEIQ